MADSLKLEKRTWEILGPLAGADRAGFGQVFEVSDGSGSEAVAKLVRKQPGADRELLFARRTSSRSTTRENTRTIWCW
jgi:hypothetical protein